MKKQGMKGIGKLQLLDFFIQFHQISLYNETLIMLICFPWLTGKPGYELAWVKKIKNLWSSVLGNTVLCFVLLLSKYLIQKSISRFSESLLNMSAGSVIKCLASWYPVQTGPEHSTVVLHPSSMHELAPLQS